MGVFREVFRRLPWAKAMDKFIVPTGIMEKRAEHIRLSREKLAARLTREGSQYDFFSKLIKEKAGQVREEFLLTQANILIVAGSETTATTLAALTYYMTTNPTKLHRLQEEVRSAFKDTTEIDGDSAQHLPYLNAVIEEGLRFFPPVPFGLPRVSTGVVIDGHYVPPGMTVSTASYTTTRSPDYWEAPHEFAPERWLPEGHPYYDVRFDNDNKMASKPFMLGPRACLGINLAYVELRIILARLTWQFEWELKSTNVDWTRDTDLRGLWHKPKLNVRFSPRVN